MSKILATSTGADLDAAIDPRFGRSPYFAVFDTGTGALEAIPNPFLDAAGGAGTQAAQWVLDHGVDILVTGRCGPKAAAALEGSGVRVIEGASGSVREAVDGLQRSLGEKPARSVGPSLGGDGRRGHGGGCGRRHGAGRGAGLGRGRCGRS